MVLSDNAVIVTGFYDFTLMKMVSLYQDRRGSLCFSLRMAANGSLPITIPRHEANQLSETTID